MYGESSEFVWTCEYHSFPALTAVIMPGPVWFAPGSA